ncbi:SLAM family member 9-like isoform X2 [Paroedura picta]|uniref:SLAM family member 9-like isoform X2 n=1 Tax=Paroedura picta TaxID=143630 RepID=UPI0040565101
MYWDGKLERRNASDRFGQRVEMAEETTLRIRALEKEDSGVLRARVLLATSDIHEQVFGLSVFEPLPDPHIRALLASQTARGCNVTLQCLASEGGGLNISWKRGDPLRVLEEGSGWYQLSAEGTDLHLSWGPGSPDSSVTCLLSSPVEQKNASLDLLSICPDKGHPRTTWFLLAVLLLLIPAAGVGSYLWKNRSSQEAVPPAALEKNGSPELLYVKLQNRRSPPEGGESQDLDQLPPGQAEASRGTMPVTIYASLLPPPAT